MIELARLARVLLVLALAGCAPSNPYSAYTPEERQKLVADAEARAAETERAREELRWADTLTDEAIHQASMEGGTRALTGIKSRGLDVFEGRWTSSPDPYNGGHRYHYDKGTYRSNPGYGGDPGAGVYRGDFLYFQDNTGSAHLTKGTFVLIGSFTDRNARLDKGIYVAENAYIDQPLRFVKATPGYLDKVEQRYRNQVIAFREAELRRQREAQASADLLFSFGQVLALGLGGLAIASADIPGADRLEIGAALFADVMTDGQSHALASVVSSRQGSYLPSQIANDGVPTGFSAVLTGDTTLLDASMARRTAPGSGIGASTVASAAPAAASGKSVAYSFSCPAGTSSTIRIPYKTEACLAAKKEMTRIYSCNLVGDFPKVSGICQNACGSPQCSE